MLGGGGTASCENVSKYFQDVNFCQMIIAYESEQIGRFRKHC